MIVKHSPEHTLWISSAQPHSTLHHIFPLCPQWLGTAGSSVAAVILFFQCCFFKVARVRSALVCFACRYGRTPWTLPKKCFTPNHRNFNSKHSWNLSMFVSAKLRHCWQLISSGGPFFSVVFDVVTRGCVVRVLHVSAGCVDACSLHRLVWTHPLHFLMAVLEPTTLFMNTPSLLRLVNIKLVLQVASHPLATA